MRRFFMLLVFAAIMSGCASSFSHNVSPGVNLKTYGTYYVQQLPADQRGINKVIEREMVKLNLQVTTGPASAKPSDVNVIVTYEDRWQWDITMYMISLKIDLRDASSNVLLATGQSSYTSLIRKSPEHQANEILETIFLGKRPVPKDETASKEGDGGR